MVSTIQLSNEVKQKLISLRKSSKETYEDIIINLIIESKKKRRFSDEEIKKAYLETAEMDLQICDEFKYSDAENLPEWED